MKGWLFFLAGVGAAIGVSLYFQGGPRVERADSKTPPIGITAAPSPALFPPGTCYLTMPVRVPTAYGTLTLPRGTALRYVGEQGGKIVVAQGEQTYTVTRDMVAGVAPTAAVSVPEQPPAAPEDSAPRGLLSTVGAAVTSLRDRLPWFHSTPAPDPRFDFQKYARFLLVADGAEGEASGSLVLYQGKVRLVTNAHVLSELPDARFSGINSQQVPAGPFS